MSDLNYCSKCGKTFEKNLVTCPYCQSGAPLSRSNSKYPALKIVAMLFKIFSVICAIIGILIFAVSFTSGGSGLNVGILAVVIGFFICLLGVAVSEGIHVLIDIEANTRYNK